MSRFVQPVMIAACALVLLAAPAAAARTRYARHRVMRAAAPPPPAAPAQPFLFYPQDVEGGVSGNLPFNNQIRKHSDPLNANGGR